MHIEVRGALTRAGRDYLVTDYDLIRSDYEGMKCAESHTQVVVKDGDLIIFGRKAHCVSEESRPILEEVLGNEVTLIRKE